MSPHEKATARPWRSGMVTRFTDRRKPTHQPPRDDYERGCVSTVDMSSDVFMPDWGPNAADTALIIEAVNRHSALLAAVEYADTRAVSRAAYASACQEDRELRDRIDVALGRTTA